MRSVKIRGPLLVGVVLLAGFAIGCMPKKGKLAPLQDAVSTYNEGIRWERYAAAAAHVPATERAVFLDERDALGKYLRITGYDVMQVDLTNPERTEANVVVKYEWYDDRKGTLHETQVAQQWERKKGQWWLLKEASVRGEEMPGILPKDVVDDEASKADTDAARAAADETAPAAAAGTPEAR